jgi:hypothetical protein
MKDQIIAEVRKHRLAHTQKFKGDLSAICNDLHRIERTSGHKLVRYAPKKLAAPTRSQARINKISGCCP